MACCCKQGKSDKASTSCLGRCDLPKHRCLEKASIKPGPVPRHMGWLYTAKDAPDFQLRCGWRPGHIACPVLRKIEQHNCMKTCEYSPCSSRCTKPPSGCCPKPRSDTSQSTICPAACDKPEICDQPHIRIVRHAGQYTICTKPSEIPNSPAGMNPLKYYIDTDNAPHSAKYSVEAKYNNYSFDYTSSKTSFVLDFSPPPPDSCCPKKY